MNRKLALFSVLAASILILVACAAGDAKKITVSTTEFMFEPTSLVVAAGEQGITGTLIVK